RQEAVAGVHGIAAGAQRRGHDEARVQVAFPCAGRADAEAAIGHARRQAVAVGVRDGEHGSDLQRLAGADHAYGDLAAIGDQYPRDGQFESPRTRKSACPNSTNSASCTQISVTTPLTPAGTAVNTFITSISP